jgi:hypothetical protein
MFTDEIIKLRAAEGIKAACRERWFGKTEQPG